MARSVLLGRLSGAAAWHGSVGAAWGAQALGRPAPRLIRQTPDRGGSMGPGWGSVRLSPQPGRPGKLPEVTDRAVLANVSRTRSGGSAKPVRCNLQLIGSLQNGWKAAALEFRNLSWVTPLHARWNSGDCFAVDSATVQHSKRENCQWMAWLGPLHCNGVGAHSGMASWCEAGVNQRDV